MKPDWKDAPEWAKYLAMDEDGTWYWYEAKPEIESTWWTTADGWKLVPVEPTHEMCGAPDVVWHPEARKIWLQMLAAAPEVTK